MMFCVPLHVHFRWGVALVGEFSIGHCSPCCAKMFSGAGGTQGE